MKKPKSGAGVQPTRERTPEQQLKTMRDVRELQDEIDEENAKVLDLEARIAGLKGQIKHHQEEIRAKRSDQRRLIRGEPIEQMLPFENAKLAAPAGGKVDAPPSPSKGDKAAKKEKSGKPGKKGKQKPRVVTHERVSAEESAGVPGFGAGVAPPSPSA